MRVLRNRRGFTLIELVVAMAVGVILGAMLMTTLRTGLVSFGKISDDMQAESQARSALTLLTVQIRQHDETDAISVLTGQSMQLRDDPANPDTSTYTVVSYQDGALISQKFDPAVSTATPVSQATVAQIDGLLIGIGTDMGTGAVMYSIQIQYGKAQYGGEGRWLKQTVTQRSAAGAS